MALDLTIRNGTLVASSGRRVADIGVAGGRIAAIGPAGSLAAARASIDATGLHVLPGVIDEHVHLREPGLEHEEDWLTGTRAAVMGGVTTVLDMPNTLPPTDNAQRARQKLALAARSAYCDFGIFGLLGESLESLRELASSGLVVGLKAFLGPTTGDLRAPDDDGLRRALEIARGAGLRVAFHAEDRAIIERATVSHERHDARAHLASRPPRAELAAIERIGRLLLETRASAHVLHLSGAGSLAEIVSLKKDTLDLTCEVTPHHLLLDADVYEHFGGMAKVNPPIRGARHAARLLAALADGRIDTVGSDHAPHLAADKQRASIWDVPAGFAGVETLLPLMLTLVNERRLTLERLVSATSERPARIWGLRPRKGAIEVGADADLTLVDLQRSGVVRAAEQHGKNNESPFEGRPTLGGPVATIVRGRVVMRDGELVGGPGWGRRVNDENDQARSPL